MSKKGHFYYCQVIHPKCLCNTCKRDSGKSAECCVMHRRDSCFVEACPDYRPETRDKNKRTEGRP